jgi:hypothetical protein
MSVGAGIALIVAASAVGGFIVFALWRRIPPVLAYVSTTACGMAIGTGALLVQEDVGAASWIVTLVVLGIIAPLHSRLVFGPPGPGRMVAPGAVAA